MYRMWPRPIQYQEYEYGLFRTRVIVGKNIYISESLTPQRKKLYGDINKFRKEIMWKFIWSHNGRIYLKKNETVTNHHAFDNADEFAKFKDRFKAS